MRNNALDIGFTFLVLGLPLFIVLVFVFASETKKIEKKLNAINMVSLKYSSDVEDWQTYEGYLDKNDILQIDGRGNLKFRVEDKEKEIDLSEYEYTEYKMPKDEKFSVMFYEISSGDYCNIYIIPHEEIILRRKLKMYWIIFWVVFLLLIVVSLTGIGERKKKKRRKRKSKRSEKVSHHKRTHNHSHPEGQ